MRYGIVHTSARVKVGYLKMFLKEVYARKETRSLYAILIELIWVATGICQSAWRRIHDVIGLT